jgi:hypothetical protein
MRYGKQRYRILFRAMYSYFYSLNRGIRFEDLDLPRAKRWRLQEQDLRILFSDKSYLTHSFSPLSYDIYHL